MDEVISRQQAIDGLRDYLVGKRCPDDGTLTCRLIENEVINKLPTAEPHSINLNQCQSSDMISRQAAVNAMDLYCKNTCPIREDGWCADCQIEELKKVVLGSATDINVATKDGTDCISRQAAIDGLAEYGNGRAVYISVKEAVRRIKQLPPIQPVIVPCDYAKACNEATMDKLTSAVAYYDALEELRKHGYVLVDMREVDNDN